MVATDRSESADRAARWAAGMAERHKAALVLIQVIVPRSPPQTEAGAAEESRASVAATELARLAEELGGGRGAARVVVDHEVAAAILRAAEEEAADVLVVGNAGMSGRKKFLLGNVPNQISHKARCTVVIVNTVTLRAQDSQTAPGIARDRTADHEADEEPALMSRAVRIAYVMARHGLREFFGQPAPDGEAAERRQARGLRAALEELGPIFAKLGQLLSTRPDLLPPAFIEELSTLQDHVPPLGEAEVVQVMEQELGVPWEDVFESIEPGPMAAGTIGQVHRATLTGGERVVVKVQRPTAQAEVMQDLGLLKLFAEKTAGRPALHRIIDVNAIFEHLSTSLVRELDFRREVEAADRLRQALMPYPRLAIPKVYAELSTSRLLVMEEVQGVPVRDAPVGRARKEAARQLLESYYRQILIDGFFHADPHPGNLMWWNDRIYFLDFGMVGELGPEVRRNLLLLLMAFWQQDARFLTDVALILAEGSDHSDIDAKGLQEDLGDLMARHRHLPLGEIQLGPILQQMTEIALRHGVPLPTSLALTSKALAQMQLATSELDPDLDAFEVAGDFVMRSVTGRIRGWADPKKISYEAEKLRIRLTRVAEAFERLAGVRPGPRLQVSFRAESLEETVHRTGRRLSLGMIGGAAVLGSAITASSANVAHWVPLVLGLVGGSLTAWLAVDLLRRGR